MGKQDEKFIWQSLFTIAGMIEALATLEPNRKNIMEDCALIGKYADEKFRSLK